MKKFIIFILLALMISKLSSNEIKDTNKTIPNIIISKKVKETNKSLVIKIKKIVFKNINSILPEYLQVEPKENFLDIKFSYDLLEKKFKTKANVKILLPYFEKKTKKVKFSLKGTTTRTYEFKIRPFIRLYKSIPTLVIKPSFTYEKSIYNNISFLSRNFYFNESIYYYTFQNEFKEVTSIILKKIINIKNLSFKISKTINSNNLSLIKYYFGFFYYSKAIKNIKVYGLKMSGDSNTTPFVQNYKLFFTYRRKLFNKNCLFLEITPYFMSDKSWHYNPKFFFTISFNIKF